MNIQLTINIPLIDILIVYFILTVYVRAHSFLLDPKGDFISFNKAECRLGGPKHEPNDDCRGPCIDVSSWQYEKDAPSSTYRRGQHVTVFWARNNHEGGFVRFAIVPDHLRMSHEAHNRLAFHFSCFDSGSHKCKFPECGTDNRQIIFRAWIQIPTIYEDEFSGVLAWSWYGGLEQNASFFGDYWSCRHIKIQGGDPLTKTFPVIFKADAGNGKYNPRTIRGESCLSSANNVAICSREPCIGKTTQFMKPAPFVSNQSPLPIHAFWREPSSLTASPSTSISSSSSPSHSATIFSTPSASATPSAIGASSTVSTSSSLSGPGSSLIPSLSTSTDNGIKTAKVLVKKVFLLDIDTMTVLEDRFYRATIIPQSISRMTFVAETEGVTSNVAFFLNGTFLKREEFAPYTAFGDNNGVYNAWPNPTFGSWLVLNVSAVSPSLFLNFKVYWIRLLRSP